MIPYGRQWIDEDDIRAVVDVLRGDWLTQGPKVNEFEKALAEYCGAKYAVALSNGTAALHLACIAAGITEGDEVITSPITFVASSNCILYCGGRPVFADIEEASYNISPEEIVKKINNKTKALLPVHFGGLPCDMEEIRGIADKHNLIVIEDACHALGARYRSQGEDLIMAGSCRHSDMTVFSFHPVKHITTGEGGAILTNNAEYYEKLLLLRSHGITKKSEKFACRDSAFSLNPESLILNPNPWYYEMQELGYNYRITDMQCALGLSQLRKNESFVARRREIAALYNTAFKGDRYIKIPAEPDMKKSAWHLYPVQIDFHKLGKNRFTVMNELNKKGIGTQVHYIPVHLQPYYRKGFGYHEGDYPVAESYYSKTLSLPMYPKMSDSDIENVIASVRGCLNAG